MVWTSNDTANAPRRRAGTLQQAFLEQLGCARPFFGARGRWREAAARTGPAPARRSADLRPARQQRPGRASRLRRVGQGLAQSACPGPDVALKTRTTERRARARVPSAPAPPPAARTSAGSRRPEAEGAWPEAPWRDCATSREAVRIRSLGPARPARWRTGLAVSAGERSRMARGRPRPTPPCAGAAPGRRRGEPWVSGGAGCCRGPKPRAPPPPPARPFCSGPRSACPGGGVVGGPQGHFPRGAPVLTCGAGCRCLCRRARLARRD